MVGARRQYLVFAVGPVQGFIAESRRTADGWVGSYLVSYLMCHVLQSLETSLGEKAILEPSLDVAMYKAVKSGGFATGDDASVASLPNTVLVEVGEDSDPDAVGKVCEVAAVKAWDDIAGAVAAEISDIKSACEALWREQVSKHWEYYWAWGGTPRAAFQNLAARKALRDFPPFEEAGDRCTVCGQRMPLIAKSALDSARGTVQGAAKSCWGDWSATLNAIKGGPNTLVRPEGAERLCAICLIKRLVPWVENPVSALWPSGGGIAAFPSTTTMCTAGYRVKLVKAAAAAPALKQALAHYDTSVQKADEQTQRKLNQAASPLSAFSEWSICASLLRGEFKEATLDALLRADGDFYLYGESVANERGFTDEAHQTVLAAYKELLRAANEAHVGRPPLYWALVAMDGDHMGKFMREAQDRGVDTRMISGALNAFAGAAPGIVQGHGGRAIFAGGDDLLAMLPLGQALDAAAALRAAFMAAFVAAKIDPVPTISAAVVFAHHQAPLGRVITAAQHLLKEWAKRRSDRDSIAVQRYQRGGPAETFAAKWGDAAAGTMVTTASMQAIIAHLTDEELADRTGYNLRRFAWVLRPDGLEPEHRKEFLVSVLSKSRLEPKAPGPGKGQIAAEMLAVCDAAAAAARETAAVATLTLEPLILARFLARGGGAE